MSQNVPPTRLLSDAHVAPSQEYRTDITICPCLAIWIHFCGASGHLWVPVHLVYVVALGPIRQSQNSWLTYSYGMSS